MCVYPGFGSLRGWRFWGPVENFLLCSMVVCFFFFVFWTRVSVSCLFIARELFFSFHVVFFSFVVCGICHILLPFILNLRRGKSFTLGSRI